MAKSTKRIFGIVFCLILIFSLSVPALAEKPGTTPTVPTMDFVVEKHWEGGGPTPYPSISLTVNSGTTPMDPQPAPVISGTGTNIWTYTYSVPVGSSYSVTEAPVANYTTSYQAGATFGVSAATVVQPCNELTFSNIDYAYIVIKLTSGDGYLVWTKTALSPAEQYLFAQNFTANGYNSMNSTNANFYSGFGPHGGITFSADGTDPNKLLLTFDAASDWATFAYGTLTLATPFIVTNTYVAPPEVGSLTISKALSEDSDPYTGSRTFTINVMFTGEYDFSDISAPVGAQLQNDGSYNVTLTVGGSATFGDVPAGAGYLVTEPTTPTDWDYDSMSFSNTNTTKTISNNITDTVTVYNTYNEPEIPPQVGSLTIAKALSEVSDPYTGNQTFTINVMFTGEYDFSDISAPVGAQLQTDGSYNVALAIGGSATFGDIPAGAGYLVTEPTTPTDWDFDSMSFSNTNTTKTISNNITDTVTVYNTYNEPEIPPQVGSLTIAKALSEVSDPYTGNQTFTINVMFTGEYDFSDISAPVGAQLQTDGSYNVALTIGGSATFGDIPAGAGYLVTEPATPTNWDYYSMSFSNTNTTRTISNNVTDTVTVYNTYNEPVVLPDTLTVTKATTGFTGTTPLFTIVVTFYNSVDNITGPGVVSGGDGIKVFTITLRGGESAQFSGIKPQTTYSVVETRSLIPSGWAYVSGEVVQGYFSPSNATVTVVNNYTITPPPPPPPPPEYGSLTVTKTISGTGAPAAEKFAITVQFSGSALGTILLNGTNNSNGKYDISLAGGNTATFTNIPYGTTYTVSEKLTGVQQNGGWAGPADQTGTIASAGTPVTVANVFTPQVAGIVEKPEVAGESEKLPQTGGIAPSTLLGLFGLVLTAAGGATLLVLKGRRQDQND